MPNVRNQRMLMEEPILEEFKQTVDFEVTTTESTFGTTLLLGKGEKRS